MLTAKRDSDSVKLLARDAQRTDGPFYCPVCRTAVTLKKGDKKIHHFAHKPPFTCSYGQGETLAHQEAKISIYDALRVNANVKNIELEKITGFGSIADVYAEIDGQKVAIEIQRSILSTAEISQRTARYQQNNVAVLWIVLQKPNHNPRKYSPSQMERWIHAAYIKRLYFWIGGESLQAASFRPFKQYVEPRSWYESGEERSAGGYDKVMKRYVILQSGPVVNISKDFVAQRYSSWDYKNIKLPARYIFSDH